MWLGTNKSGTKFLSLLVELMELIRCVPDLNGDNLYLILFAIIRNFLFVNNRTVLKMSELYSTKCFLFSLNCKKTLAAGAPLQTPLGHSAPPDLEIS